MDHAERARRVRNMIAVGAPAARHAVADLVAAATIGPALPVGVADTATARIEKIDAAMDPTGRALGSDRASLTADLMTSPPFLEQLIIEAATLILEFGAAYPRNRTIAATKKRRRDEVDSGSENDDDGEVAPDGKKAAKLQPPATAFPFDANFLPEPGYRDAAQLALTGLFSRMPIAVINREFRKFRFQFVPAAVALQTLTVRVQTEPDVYRPMKNPRSVNMANFRNDDVTRQVKYFQDWLAHEKAEREAADRKEQARKLAEERGELITCGCCFCDELPEDTTTCLQGHAFCHECLRRNADVCVGDRKPAVLCMDQSGCQAGFRRADLKKVCTKATMRGLDKVAAEAALRAANLDGFYDCPFCDYGAIVGEEFGIVFKCENCFEESCIKCRRKAHIPNTCEDAAKNDKLNAQHLIEEKLTEALIRECPMCRTKITKENGCNKMTCRCGALFCYCCRALIKDYTHFAEDNRGRRNTSSKCPLFDDTNHRHALELREAEKQAREELAQAGVEPTELPAVGGDAPGVPVVVHR
ncbi:hypothetical protein AMAG_09153 [Allomyces macrogynus ATCC 38327]|uniref:RING-type domain-containing protein n=1 Tax=Allomyces macrogynus (strain ATCC 38327) TaxID=578462 RepID=A0A0L0SNJ4_ALLM3|nr:hypothetical protein AMAG_09153 [Allomyces macrogynus ATCC 38327]|eukprot:KNE64091.1 hypothetical protein AMAG_09153 [Allomyces macrogynus ATCC 38327]